MHVACGKCHFGIDPATATVDQLMREPYTDDAHSHGLFRAGLAVSANCTSCHGGHGVRAMSDPESPLARTRVHEVCGTCHIGIVDWHVASVRGRRRLDRRTAPVWC